MLPSRLAPSSFGALLAGFLLASCTSTPSEDAEAAAAPTGRVEGRLYPIADSPALDGIVPAEIAERAREVFDRESPISRQTQALGAVPITPDPNPPLVFVEEEPDFVRGEAIVRLRRSAEETLQAIHAHPDFEPYRFEVGAWGTPDIVSIRFHRGGAVPTASETIEVAERLHHSGMVGYAHPNQLIEAQTVPNDEHYDRTWHLHMLDMEAAWSITTGSPDVVIAVIDSGVREHEDLSRLLPGYDFISDPQMAGDGDGRDPDPSPVDFGRSGYHGQHVAGTIAADGNNGIGIPGMDWQAQVLPVRALGVDFGTSIDVIAAIQWSSGGEVPGVPPNPHPADILNLSLGGRVLVPSEQEAVDLARARGSILVVAAGNSARDASRRSYAGYRGVIVVGATDPQGNRATYSNFGSVVDVMAPGGDYGRDENGLPNRVYSLWFQDSGAVDSYRYQQGTSMAAPHVSGLIGLMKAVEPTLEQDLVADILRETADPESRCHEGCGAGLIDPQRALEAARARGPREARLHLGLDRLDLGPRIDALFPLKNEGNASLSWFARLDGPLASHLEISANAGTLPPGASRSLTITVNRFGLEEGRHEATLELISPSGVRRVPITFSVGGVSPPDLGTALVIAFSADEREGSAIGGRTTTDASSDYAFSLSLPPGEWYLAAILDRDGDGSIGPDDLLGFWPRNVGPEAIVVEEDGLLEDLQLILEPAGP